MSSNEGACRKLGLAGAILAAATLSAATARADVTVFNNTNETLYIATGDQVNGKLFSRGWYTVQSGRNHKVYQGEANQIIICMFTIRDGQKVYRQAGGNAGMMKLQVSDDAFECEQAAPGVNVWYYTNRRTMERFTKDDNSQWPDWTFPADFWVINGRQDRNEIP